MKQVIPGAWYDMLSPSATEYNTLIGHTWTSSEALRRHTASAAGTISRLLIELSGSPGAGKSYTFTLMKNGVATDLAVTIADTATTGSDLTDSVSVSGGDVIGLRCTPSGTPTSVSPRWSVLFEGSTANQSWIPGITQPPSVGTRHAPLRGGGSTSTTAEADARQVIPTAGKIRNLYISGDTSPGGGTKTYRFTLRKNGVSTALTCDMVGDATTASDTTNEITVAAGDYVSLMVEPVNSPSNTPYCAFGTTFVADTDGESVVLGGTTNALSNTATEYTYAGTTILTMSWITGETSRYQGAQPTTFKKLHVLLNGAPGTGKSFALGLRHNGTTKISVTIADAATSGSNLVDTFDPADFDEINMICVPSGTPTSRDAYWGFVGYIAPGVVSENRSAFMPFM